MKQPKLISCARPIIVVADPKQAKRLREAQQRAFDKGKAEGKLLVAVPLTRRLEPWTAKKEIETHRRMAVSSNVTTLYASKR